MVLRQLFNHRFKASDQCACAHLYQHKTDNGFD
ncbi:Uncharacterised protein [Vibrio cholerae]|nr:Uncharacterised protein [Vibrio cholerae]